MPLSTLQKISLLRESRWKLRLSLCTDQRTSLPLEQPRVKRQSSKSSTLTLKPKSSTVRFLRLSDSGDGLEKTSLVLLVRQMSIIQISTTKHHQLRSSNKRPSLAHAKSWTMVSIHQTNGAISLVFTKEPTMLSAATCNFSSLKRNNNKYLRALLHVSLICQSLMLIHTKILSSASVKRKLVKAPRNFTSWKLELQQMANKKSREHVISKFNKKVTSQF